VALLVTGLPFHMSVDAYLDRIDQAFQQQKDHAINFIDNHNQLLPTDSCPFCKVSGHVPGLKCPDCLNRWDVPFAILRSTEWGWSAVAIDDQKHILAKFDAEGI